MSLAPQRRPDHDGPQNPEGRQFRIYDGSTADAPTLCRFGESWYIKHMSEITPKRKKATIAEVSTALGWWSKLTGDPPLDEITPAACARFVESLRETRGKTAEKKSTWTIEKIVRTLRTVLLHAGPAGHQCPRPAEEKGLFGRDEEGIPRQAPWFPLIECKPQPPRKCLGPEQICQLVAAAEHAIKPVIATFPDITPPAWWRGIYRFAFWTGLRKGSLLALRRSWISRDKDLVWIEIPGEHYKGGRSEYLWLHPRALAALELTGSADEVFPWPHSLTHFDRCHERLLAKAGFLPLTDFMIHGIRRTIGSALYEIRPTAAETLLRHKDTVTTAHYVQILSRVKGMRAELKPILDRIAKKYPEL
jgi:integrase